MNKSQQKTLIQIDSVSKYYPQTKTQALKGVTLSIGKGDFVSIKGPSGSGKTTLLYLIAGLLAPSEGKIFFGNQSLSSIRNMQSYRKKNIGFIFQDFYLNANFSVIENVLLPFACRLWPKKSLVTKADYLLEYLGLAEKRVFPTHQLSSGERQRVCIARALINDPLLILADEPTGNLDTENSKRILRLLKKINMDKQSTMIIVTHDDEVAHFSDRIINIVDGQVA